MAARGGARGRSKTIAVCGIAGFTHLRPTLDRDHFAEVIRSLSHRGPDRCAIHQSGTVSLGATRLSIRDVDAGDQPMANDSGDLVIVFNGEIYNDTDLRHDLTRLGHQFRTRSDTEVVLRAFEQWDKGCFPLLRGMFALAIWNEPEKRLVLARDRLGIKPLYLHRRGQDLYFGSEIKAIVAHPEVDRRLDVGGLGSYLCLNYAPGPGTLLEGIEKLAPGHWLEWRDGRETSDRYWRLALDGARGRPLEEAKCELDRLLNSAAREHLASDVPVGVWASGGLDSSTILHYAAANSGSRVKTFSISFAGRSFDESRYFREIAARYGTEHHELDLNPGADLEATIPELVHYLDEPIADAGVLPVWYLSKLSRQHVTVALSGEGADEMFGGYLSYRADVLARRMSLVPRALRRLGLRALRYWPVSNGKISFEYKAKRFLEGSLLDPDAAHCFWYGGFSPRLGQTLMQGADHGGIGRLYGALSPGHGGAGTPRYLWFDQMYYLPDDILLKCDRMSMAHSLEVRPPFLDHRIVEFAASLPAGFKIRGSKQKYLLRELMESRLPRSVLKRKKEGFDIPAGEWLRGPLRPLLLDTLTPQAIGRTNVLRPDRIQAIIDSHMSGRENWGVPLWGLMILFLWIRHWRVA